MRLFGFGFDDTAVNAQALLDPLPVPVWRVIVIAVFAALIYAVANGAVAAGGVLAYLLLRLAPAVFRRDQQGNHPPPS